MDIIKYRKAKKKRDLHLKPSIPNSATMQVIKEVRKDKGVICCKDADELFKNLSF